MRQRSLALAAVTGALAISPASALAAVGFGTLPQFVAETAMNSMGRCEAPLAPAAGEVQLLSPVAHLDKASAILGGRASRLNQIARQQAGATPHFASAAPAVGAMPAAPGRGSGGKPCQQLSLPSAAIAKIQPGVRQNLPGADDFLASKRLRIQRTGFDAAWSRVQRQTLSRSVAAGLSRMTSGSADMATLAAVNSWTNARIRYVEDSVLYGKADYWAGARATLRRRAGDCEDIAITKLQLLAALGVPRSDMYLTVARDLARNADHAVLVVKLDGRNWLLDNSTNELLNASLSYDYRPIMSFSTSGKWLHGYSQL